MALRGRLWDFLPAGLSFARSRAPAGQEIAWIGYFTAAQIVPSLFAPTLAERFLSEYGPNWFFVIMSAPIGGAIILVLPLLRHRNPDRGAAAVADAPQGQCMSAAAPVGTYRALLHDPRLIAPLLVIAVSGLAWGFSASFLALLLRNHDVAIGAFFTSFAATTLLTRFGLLRWLQRLPQLVLAEAALIVIAMEFLLLAMIVTPIVAICAGVLFGLGYAVIFPTVTNWAAALYPGRERSRPIALTTSGFHAGALAAPLLTGFALAHTGYPPVLAMLAAVTLAVGSVIAVHERGAGDAPLAATSYDTEHERIEIAPADDQLAAFFRRERHHRPPR